MKKTILSAAFTMAFTFAVAQTAADASTSLENKYRFYHPFELSVNIGETVSPMALPDSHFSAGGKLGWTAGVTAQFNEGHLGTRFGLSYELNRSHFPDQINPFNSTFSFRQSALNLSVTQLFKSNDKEAFGLYVGAGFNMRYAFNPTLESLNYKAKNVQWNFDVVLGFRFSHLYIEDDFNAQMNTLFKTDQGAPKSYLNVSTLKIGWVF